MRISCITWNKHSKTNSGKMTTLRYTFEGVTEQDREVSWGKKKSFKGTRFTLI